MSGRIHAAGFWAVAVLALLSALAFAESASAANRWVAPGGTGPWPCVQANPCALKAAAENGSLADGDHILLLSGANYEIGVDTITVAKAVTIRPAPGVGRANIRNTGGDLFLLFAKVTLQDLNLTATGSGPVINTQAAARIERVTATSTGANQIAIFAKEGTVVRDSLARATGNNGRALLTGNNGATIRNVTAIGSGPVSHALTMNTSYGGNQHVHVANSIFKGVSGDITLLTSGGMATGSLTIVHSSYDPANVNYGGPQITLTAGPGNQNSGIRPPLFANPAGGNYRQLRNSPTVNAGTDSPARLPGVKLANKDLFGSNRIQASRPDIGFHEYSFKPKAKLKGKSKKKGKRIRLRIRCDENCRVRIGGGVKTKTRKNLKANKWRNVNLKVKKPRAKRAKLKLTVIDTDGQRRKQKLKVRL